MPALREVLPAGSAQSSRAAVLSEAGVPEGERKRIFQRFYRLEASRTTAGNGLGLSIVAAVADLHAAELKAGDNHPGLKVAILFPAA